MAPAGDAPARTEAWLTRLAPLLVGLGLLAAWEAGVRAFAVPFYILPGPLAIASTLNEDWATLSRSLLITLKTSVLALVLSAVAGIGLSLVFKQSRWIERAFSPYAVVLQVTPIIAIAPLVIIWVGNLEAALLICAFIVAFFPMLSNTMLGLSSADRDLQSLFQLYRATRWQVFWRLQLPSALPYIMGGLKISGGLALIGAVAAEFVAGSGGSDSGLAYRILESSHQLKIPRMFAALALISLSGIGIHLLTSGAAHLVLRGWHESARERDG